jgi:glycerophosphoryl diester phosphodiesterase
MRSPWIIAHRGASGYTPENTMAAFERAVQLGAGFIETDLHLTRDVRFVAIHDDTLERTSSGHGRVRDHTLAELRALDVGWWYDRQFAGQRIPTLEEILAFAREHDVVFYLEIKQGAGWGMHHALVGALQNPENAARTVVVSFDASTLAPLRKLDAGIMIGLLVDEARPDPVKAATDLGARQLCPRASLITSELVNRAHAADLQVVTWTVNDPGQMRSLIQTGVDGIMTDRPDRLRAVIEDLSSDSPLEQK